MITLSRRMPLALAITGLAVLSARAYAADTFDEVTVSAPAVKTVGHDYATNAPIQDVTVTARVQYDPVTLTTHSGVSLLKDSVLTAAREACYDAGPLSPDDGTCIFEAVKSAEPQIDAAVARARSSANS
jgi:UrcA family protein